jgi:hypothetical protein
LPSAQTDFGPHIVKIVGQLEVVDRTTSADGAIKYEVPNWVGAGISFRAGSCRYRRATEHQKRENSVFDTRDRRSAGGHKDQHCSGLRVPILKLPARVKTLLSPMSADTWGQELVCECPGSAPNTGCVQVLTSSEQIRKVYRVHGSCDRSRSGSSR